jgi:Arc/MetJ family transcription regulator
VGPFERRQAVEGRAHRESETVDVVVFGWCMARTNIYEAACAVVMRRYGLHPKRETVNFALPELAGEMTCEGARRLKGSGWVGALDEVRSTLPPRP